MEIATPTRPSAAAAATAVVAAAGSPIAAAAAACALPPPPLGLLSPPTKAVVMMGVGSDSGSSGDEAEEQQCQRRKLLLRAALLRWRRLARSWARLPPNRTVDRWGRRLALRNSVRRWAARQRRRRQLASGVACLERALLRRALQHWAAIAARRSALKRVLQLADTAAMRRAWDRLREAAQAHRAALILQRALRQHALRRAAVRKAVAMEWAAQRRMRRAVRMWRGEVVALRQVRRSAGQRLVGAVARVLAANALAQAWGRWREQVAEIAREEAAEVLAAAHAAARAKRVALREWRTRTQASVRRRALEEGLAPRHLRRWRLTLAVLRRLPSGCERGVLQRGGLEHAERHRVAAALWAWAGRARRRRAQRRRTEEGLCLADVQRPRFLLQQWRRHRALRAHARLMPVTILTTRLLWKGFLALWRHRQAALRVAEASLRAMALAEQYFLRTRGWRRLCAAIAQRARQRLLLTTTSRVLAPHQRPGRFLPRYRIRRVRTSFAYSQEVAAAHARSMRASHGPGGVAAARAFVAERLRCALSPDDPEQQEQQHASSRSLSLSRSSRSMVPVQRGTVPTAVLARLGDFWFLHRWLRRWHRRAAWLGRVQRAAPRHHEGNLQAWALAALFQHRCRHRHARLAWRTGEGHYLRRLVRWLEPVVQAQRQQERQCPWGDDDEGEDLGETAFSLSFSYPAPPPVTAQGHEKTTGTRRLLPFASPLSPSSSSSCSFSSSSSSPLSLPPPTPTAALATPIRAALSRIAITTPRTGGTTTFSTPRFVARIRKAFSRQRQQQGHQQEEEEEAAAAAVEEQAVPEAAAVSPPRAAASAAAPLSSSTSSEADEEEGQQDLQHRRIHVRRRFPPEAILVFRHVLAALAANAQRRQRAALAHAASDRSRRRRVLIEWRGRVHRAGVRARGILLAAVAVERATLLRGWWRLRRRLGQQWAQRAALRTAEDARAMRLKAMAVCRLSLRARQRTFHRQAVIVQGQRRQRRMALRALAALREGAAPSLSLLRFATRRRVRRALQAAFSQLRCRAVRRREQRASVAQASAIHEGLAASRATARWAHRTQAQGAHQRGLARAGAFHQRHRVVAPALWRWRRLTRVQRRFRPQRQIRRAETWRRRRVLRSALLLWLRRVALAAGLRALSQRSRCRRALLSMAAIGHRARDLRDKSEALRCRHILSKELFVFLAWRQEAQRRRHLRAAFVGLRARAEQRRGSHALGVWAVLARAQRRDQQLGVQLTARREQRLVLKAFLQWNVMAQVSQHERAWAWARAQRALWTWLLWAQARRLARQGGGKEAVVDW